MKYRTTNEQEPPPLMFHRRALIFPRKKLSRDILAQNRNCHLRSKEKKGREFIHLWFLRLSILPAFQGRLIDEGSIIRTKHAFWIDRSPCPVVFFFPTQTQVLLPPSARRGGFIIPKKTKPLGNNPAAHAHRRTLMHSINDSYPHLTSVSILPMQQ